MSGSVFAMDDIEFKFEDKELRDLLSSIDTGHAHPGLSDGPPEGMMLPLQFQPHQPGPAFAMQGQEMPQPSMSLSYSEASPVAGGQPRLSFDSAAPTQAAAMQMQRHSFDGTSGLQPQYNGIAVVNGQLQPSLVMYQTAPQPGQALAQPVLVLQNGLNGLSYNMAGNGNVAYTSMMTQGLVAQQQQQQQHQMQHQQQQGAPAGGSLWRGISGGAAAVLDKVSHSNVEKLRRDRINMLIEELRELVPPSASSNNKLDGLESRRPKHVVLADTITLLRNMKTVPPAAQATCEVKQELDPTRPRRLSSGMQVDGVRPAHSGTKSNGFTSDQDELDVNGAPQLPVIPMQPNLNRGVSVERGPDCMYVQVKCQDRRGLLSDIINALHSLPLEIRTASVTTTADGSVRDVFEVMPDSSEMAPEAVQNLVHDALFQPGAPLDHKRARGVHA